MSEMLRCVTYLAAEDGEAGLPRSLFSGIVDRLAQQLSVPMTLRSWTPPSQGTLQGFVPVSLEEIRGGVPWAAMQAAW